MTIGLVGKKQGMTRMFTPEGDAYAVSVVSVSPNTITQIKSQLTDGYSSVQVTTGEKKDKHVKKPTSGHFKKKGVNPGEGLWEFKVNPEKLENLEVGGQLSLEQFEEGQVIDVQGKSKGKGFAGTVKRWNFKMQDATHGNSISHRAPGSIGQCQTPGKVWKGKKMPGHMGDKKQTVQNLVVVETNLEKGYMLLRGSVPGSKSGFVRISKAIKK